jgi:dTDP-glucose 4,6-dehydratase
MRVLLTGGAGFIGSNHARHLAREHPDWTITVLDALTYAGDPANLQGLLDGGRVRLVEGRIEDPELVGRLMPGTDAVIHLAAETHVDRSIQDPAPFITTNVLGTQVLLEAARRAKVRRFLHVSTDEVYGSLGPTGVFAEFSPLRPRSPYAASKAGGDLLVQAYAHTYGLPAVVVRPANTYGPCQFPEKLLPVLITNALEGSTLPLYGNGQHVRDWLWVDDLCRGLDAALLKGEPGDVMNLGAGQELTNLQVAHRVLDLLGKPLSLVVPVTDRPGHDFRYALDSTLAGERLAWKADVTFDEGLERLVAWFRNNPEWWRSRKRLLERSSRGFWTSGDSARRRAADEKPGAAAAPSTEPGGGTCQGPLAGEVEGL